MGWIKRPHVLQILQIRKHKLSLCFSRICQDRQWDNAPHGSMHVCMFIRVNATQHACGLSGKDLFVVNQKRHQECTTRPPASCHVSYSSHILAPIHWFLPSRLSLSPPLSFQYQAACLRWRNISSSSASVYISWTVQWNAWVGIYTNLCGKYPGGWQNLYFFVHRNLCWRTSFVRLS